MEISTPPWFLLQSRLVPVQWQFLQGVAQAAADRHWHLYLVGGAVRDLYLSKLNSQLNAELNSHSLVLPDLDLVVEGYPRDRDNPDGTEAAGVALAQVLLHTYPGARLDVHGRFQTAALQWHHDPILGCLSVDIATARTEVYPYPAANPEVAASSIRQDLYRRDFTINALAIRLTPPHSTELLDCFGGLSDLEAGLLRTLHPQSFIEDPTRIYRGVRFAVRLGFRFEPQTLRSLQDAIESGVYDRIQTEQAITPALQTRLRSELQYLFDAPYWKPALQGLGSLKALSCIHRSLELTPLLWQKIRLANYCLRYLPHSSTETPLTQWLLFVEVLLAHLAPADTDAVATKLQLPTESIHRLQQLPAIQAHLQVHLEQAVQVQVQVQDQGLKSQRLRSQVVKLFTPYDRSTLILVALQTSSRHLRRSVWQYLTHWRWIKAPLTGHDLKALGYQPGKAFKTILDRLLAAYLDGQLTANNAAELREKAIVFVQHHWPLLDRRV